MIYSYKVQYLKCQSCSARIHCKNCAQEISEYLLRKYKLNQVELDLESKQTVIRAENMTEDMVLDYLEDAQLFV